MPASHLQACLALANHRLDSITSPASPQVPGNLPNSQMSQMNTDGIRRPTNPRQLARSATEVPPQKAVRARTSVWEPGHLRQSAQSADQGTIPQYNESQDPFTVPWLWPYPHVIVRAVRPVFPATCPSAGRSWAGRRPASSPCSAARARRAPFPFRCAGSLLPRAGPCPPGRRPGCDRSTG
jgi:hypothetical protein